MESSQVRYGIAVDGQELYLTAVGDSPEHAGEVAATYLNIAREEGRDSTVTVRTINYGTM